MHPSLTPIEASRRGFLKVATAATALPVSGLVIGFAWPVPTHAQATAGPAPLSYQPNAWVRIAADNSVTIISHKVEMGQGAYTGVPLLIAEELEVDVRRVVVQAAPPGAAYADPFLGGFQMTGGSTTVRSGWDALRKVGATARVLLVQAAAQRWGVGAAECSVADGVISHRGSGRSLSYGAVAEAAASLPAPTEVPLKPESAFTQVGKPVIRLDAAAKTDGSAQFGIDVRVSGMAVAALVLPPHDGATVAGIDNEAQAQAVRGVQKVLRFPDFVAVLAGGYAAANKAARLLKVRWTPGPGAQLSSAGIERKLAAALDGPMAVARNEGDVQAGATPRRVQAEYRVPFLAHAPMEPVNCTVAYRGGKAEVWVGTQVPVFAVQAVAQVGGIQPQDVTLNTPFLGGGFGRRLEVDFIVKAAIIAKTAGQPVKTIYSRENDIRGDLFRSAGASRLVATLGADGLPRTWHHRIAGGSIYQRFFPPLVKDGIDETSTEGAHDLLYTIPNQRVELGIVDMGVPVAFWRSVGYSHNTFIAECFLDECAAAAKVDPLRYRQRLLAKDARFMRVLATVADQSAWGRPLPRGRFRGVAAAKPFGTYVAAVVEVQMTGSNEFRLSHVWTAVDAGKLAAPDVCKAQIESGVVWGLTAALFDRITFKNGQVEQSNFNDYRVLQLAETPPIDVRFIASGAPPGGIGEPGVPCIAPALANALSAATGKRVRSLPLSSLGLTLA
jgi:isoquinoline 1-oxidoreductase subunit beta